MPKTYEVLVEVVVTPSKWPKVLAAIAILLVIGCLLVSGVGYLSNKNQQQVQTATAIANANATATAYSAYIATQSSVNATAIAYQPTANALATATSMAARTNMIKVTDVKLLTFGQVQPGRCGDLQPCNKVAFIQFTITNNMGSEAYVYLSGPCGHPGEIDPSYGPQAVFIDGRMSPGKSGTMICMLYSIYDYDPKTYVIEVTQPSCWKIFPYTGEIKDCQ